MTRSCEQATEQIYFYLDGEMSYFRRMKIRWHLRRCSHCDCAFDFEEKVKEMVRTKGRTEPSPELIQRLHTLLREEAGDESER
jgi:mycothiol system anti-sigma-R factor